MSAIYGEDLIRSGVTRKTQDTNVLLVHSKLGEVRERGGLSSSPQRVALSAELGGGFLRGCPPHSARGGRVLTHPLSE